MNIKLSVVILTWNSEQYISNCLSSILSALKEIQSEVIVVDNGSTDSTRELISRFHDKRLQIVYQSKNKGVAAARNIGFRMAKGEYILQLDVDTVSNEEAIHALYNFMEEHSDCGISGCKLLNTLGNVQNSCRKIPTVRYKLLNILEAFFDKIKLSRLKRYTYTLNKSQFYSEQFEKDEAFGVEYLIGACQMTRRTVFEEVGFLDENIFYGPEDADFCIRVCKKGWKIYYLPYVSIIHEYQQISRKRFLSRMSFIHLKGLLYFFWKHRHI